MDSSRTGHLKPPVASTGAIGWMKVHLFNGVFNSLLTLFILFFLYQILPSLFRWIFLNSLWCSSPAECHDIKGACWSVISNNYRFILFGFYPHDMQWRPLTAMVLLIMLLMVSRNRSYWKKQLLYAWIAGLCFMAILMKGGLLGLAPVESTQWGGLPLTFLLAAFGLAAAYPVGVLLALGRRSSMPAIKALCIVYIEIIRGVPLVSLLFMSAVVFPLFLPEGITINKILRAQAAIIMFTAAYIAEVVRGGLQAVAKGQYEAAESLGLTYVQTLRLVILPQALKIVIPPTVSILISAFKDTSLVVIIGLYDILKTTQTILANPSWMGFSTEAFFFLACIYFICCYAMSNYSRQLEREL